MAKIGFVGTGIMGRHMAGHLLAAGHELYIYSRTKSKAEPLLAQGANWCATAGECAAQSEYVFTIVGYPADVEEVYFGENGILANAKTGSYVVDMTTSSPELAQKIYECAQKKGIHALDAPVTGGDGGAKSATLTILVGGDAADFQAILPILEKMGRNIVHEGAAGAGQQTKACNQIAIAGALMGACEAFAYAQRAGLDLEKVYAAISQGAASSYQLSKVVKKAIEGDFVPNFLLKHFVKDMRLGKEAAAACGLELPVLSEVLKETEELEARGMGDEGTQSLLKYYLPELK